MTDDSLAVRAAVVASWQETVGVEPAPDLGDVSFWEAGGDSRAAVRLLDRLYGRLGAKVTLRQFFAGPTVDALVSVVMAGEGISAAERRAFATVVRLRSTEAEILWCFFPPLSGATARYARMAQLLPPGHGVWGCQTPLDRGTGGLDGLTQVLVSALRHERADVFRRVHFVGWSLGGMLALEAARALAAQGGSPDWLGEVFLLDPTPPGQPPDSYLEILEVFITKTWEIADDPSLFLTQDGELDAARIVPLARAMGTLEPAGTDEDVRDAWVTYLANAALVEGYEPRALPDRRPWLLHTDEAADGSLTVSDDPGAWGELTIPERCSCLHVKHGEMFSPPNDGIIANWMIDAAARAEPA